MPLFSYRVAKGDGTILEQRIEAESEALLRSRLEGEGYLVLSISKAIGFSIPTFTFKRKIAPRDFLVFNQELMVLLKAGLPIMKILDILTERGSQAGFVSALKVVQNDVRGGSAIADALSKHPAYFSGLYISSLRAGEKSGNLVEVIGRFMEYQKKMLNVRKKVVAALAYPSFLLATGIGVLAFLLVYVMPSFSEVYEGSKQSLPFFTRSLLGIVQAITSHSISSLVALILVAALGWAVSRTEWVKTQADRFAFKVPFLGPIFRRNHQVRLSRTLSTILKSGIPLVTALQMSAAAMTSRMVRLQIEKVGEEVKGGVSLAAAFTNSALFPKMSTEMISVGETTGSLEEMLLEVANFHEEELDLYLSRVTMWVEPVLLLFIGSLVAMILIAMYLPIFHLAGAVR